MEVEFLKKSREYDIKRIFDAYDDDMDGSINISFIIEELKHQGIKILEEEFRFKEIREYIGDLPGKTKSIINFEHFLVIINLKDGDIIERALLGKLIVPDFYDFSQCIEKIYNEVISNTDGHNATYIPQLAEVDPELFAIAACTVDGQQWEIGDIEQYFWAQSWSKAISYCIAVEENGIDYVHKHVGKEPSGAPFNKNFLNSMNLPHNPMINSGAIMVSALIQPKLEMYQRYKYIKEFWSELAGGARIGFQNATYLSEKDTASRNFCLAHMMKDANAFPKDTDIDETLDIYFQLWSIEVNSKDMSVIAASLANGGVCPITKKKIF